MNTYQYRKIIINGLMIELKYSLKLEKIYIKLIIIKGHQIRTKDLQGIWLLY